VHVPISPVYFRAPIISRAIASPSLVTEITHNLGFQIVGITLTVLVTVIGIRMILYWTSFVFQAERYRQLRPVSTAQLRILAENWTIPFLKVQFTTLGSPGSSEVILRGLRQLEDLVLENPAFYGKFLSAEVVTENPEQAEFLTAAFAGSPVRVDCVTTPASYQTARNTQLKAKQLHYLVELRRAGWNARPGRTFIIHFDEDTLMVPAEFRKMIAYLTFTDKKVLTGPIYYPLEYQTATRLARVTEATRPITCFECRRVMETGVPLHVHGSNLVVEEEMENRVGWDIGTMDGVPFVAEDYMFGMDVFLKEGREAFGWHGCVALEQPPFSFPSVYRQRYRWVFGVLQGMSVDTHLPEFKQLPWLLRMKVIWGTRYRISTYALGTILGSLSLLFLPAALLVTVMQLRAGEMAGVSPLLDAWFATVGFMWLGTSMMGAWMNVLHAGYTGTAAVNEILRAIVISPVAGLMENMAAMMAVAKWLAGSRGMVWHTTPSTKAADDALRGKSEIAKRPLIETVTEAKMPQQTTRKYASLVFPIMASATAFVVSVYIGVPVMLSLQDTFHTSGIMLPSLGAVSIIVTVTTSIYLRVHKLTTPAKIIGRHERGTIPTPSKRDDAIFTSTITHDSLRDTTPMSAISG
jgi:hypothetical protein